MATRSILVVDDDERVLAGYRRSLDRGWQLFTSTNAATAVRIAQQHELDLAIIDLYLGGTSSIDLIREVHAVCPTARIATVSGYLTTESTVIAVRAGAEVVLDKPIAPREVIQRLMCGHGPDIDPDDRPTLAEAMDAYVARVFADCDGNVSETARRLGIYRSSLQRRFRKHTVKRPS